MLMTAGDASETWTLHAWILHVYGVRKAMPMHGSSFFDNPGSAAVLIEYCSKALVLTLLAASAPSSRPSLLFSSLVRTVFFVLHATGPEEKQE